MNPFKKREFRKLQKYYYDKLREGGFEDIEETDSPKEMLKTWHSSYFQYRHGSSEFREITQYFTAARSVLNDYTFSTDTEKAIWELHAEGFSLRKISEALGINKDVVHKCIKMIRRSFTENHTNYSVNLVAIRTGEITDKEFIYATWLRPFYYDNDYIGEIQREIFFSKYPKAINMILGSRNVSVTIACLMDEPDVVLGYSVIEGNKLHWVYVKKAWRQLGIAKKLIPEGITSCSHLTCLGKLLKPLNWKFDPFFY